MPELPEVETVRRGLDEQIQSHPMISAIHLQRGDLRFPMPLHLSQRLKGALLERVERRAKYLLIHTSRGILLSHLGMTGSWRIRLPHESQTLQLHEHIEIELSDGRALVFRDPRRFGVFDLIESGLESQHKLLRHLGPEPLSEEFNAEFLFQRSRKRSVAIKVFLMDQKVVVGVGNIYASEALFRAGVRPSKRAGQITRGEAERLIAAIRSVLAEAIQAGGSSIQDFRGASGAAGYFQNSHAVYDREGEPCLNCQTPLKAKVLGGRSTYWCPRCQK